MLLTKLYPPPAPPSLVPRPRLIAQLEAGLAGKLTLVSAPPGFGKTSLLASWLAGRASAWLSLDEEDNDPTRFLAYLLAALQQIDGRWGATAAPLLASASPTALLSLLLNDLSQYPTAGVLVLDDYHVITAESIHTALTFWVDHLPPHLHLILTSRADPPLPLARWRVRRHLNEIRTADLRFTAEETAQFWHEHMGEPIPSPALATLAERTEGWVASLHLAALSLRGRSASEAAEFVRGFTGSHAFIVDYLVEEVLHQQAPADQEFLLHTAVLDQLNGDLVNALLGRTDGHTVLERLYKANLFLIPLDQERRWYRYHHLFREALLGRLPTPTRANLHRRAGQWLASHGRLRQAIPHALAAGDEAQAAEYLETIAPQLLEQNELASLHHWFGQLSAAVVEARLPLLLAEGWALALWGQGSAAATLLGRGKWPAEGKLAAEHALLQATIARQRGDKEATLALTQQALALAPPEAEALQADIWRNLGQVWLMRGDWLRAAHALGEAIERAEDNDQRGHGLVGLGILHQSQGELREAAVIFRQVLALPAPNPATGMAALGLGMALAEWNELTEAAHWLVAGIGQVKPSLEQYMLARGYVALAQVQQAQGLPTAALATLTEAEDWFGQVQILGPGPALWLAPHRARLWLQQGQVGAAVRWAETHTIHSKGELAVVEQLTLVRLRLAQNQPRLASDHLTATRAIRTAEEQLSYKVEVALLEALCQQKVGNTAAVGFALGRALEWAEPAGYVRLFLNEGVVMADLLRHALVQGMAPAYVGRLLAGWGAAVPTPHSPLPDPPTARELEILRLLNSGATNQEIADALVVAVSTVKKHISNLLTKLDATNRVEALARARDAGLL